ncbi:MAG TPA: GAF domain-containing protein, partial [Burkholderiales bacterium]|nr:GAF domain-containing protein [Burkholderiales bacterium]
MTTIDVETGWAKPKTPENEAERLAAVRLGELLDKSASQLYLLDPQTLRCVYANQGALAQTGYSLTELQQLDYASLYPELERETLERDIKLLRTGARRSVDVEAQCRRKDGSTFLNRATYQFHADGSPPMITVICEDVTDRKRVGQELQTYVAGLTAIISMQQDIAVSAPDLERLMRMIVVRARQITGARGAAIEMVEGDRLVYRAGTDDILAKLGLSFPLDGSLPGTSIREGKALRCNETQADPRVNREETSRLGMRSMVVAPFYRERKAAGVLTVFSGEPHAFTEQTQQLVQLLATTLGSAMQRQAAEQAILEIARGATIETGRDFFKTLVSELAGLLNASYVFVGEIDGAAKDAIRIVALNAKGEMKEGIRYALHGTPCQNVMEAEPFTVVADLKARFPDDRMFDTMDVESYSGVPLLGSDREPIGLLGAMFGEPLEDPEKIESTLHIFAARAASELERQHTEKRLRDQTGLMQSVLDGIADGVVVVDGDGQLVMANPAARRIVGQAYPQGVPLNGWPEHLGIFGPDGKTPYGADELPLALALRGQATDGVEVVIRNKANPEGVAVNVHGRPLYAVEGDVTGGVAVLRDV